MAYRFTDTNKWVDGWFSELKPLNKLLFLYLCDQCDIAGFLEVNTKKISFDLGIGKQEVERGLRELESRIMFSFDSKFIFIKNFIKHQKNLPLNEKNPAHKGTIKKLNEHLLNFGFKTIDQFFTLESKPLESPLKAPLKPLESPIGNGIGNTHSIISNTDISINNITTDILEEESKPLKSPLKAPLNNDISFDSFWDLYDKKIGDKRKIEPKWNKLSDNDKKAIMDYIPKYIQSQPDKQYRKNPETFLNNQGWKDEIIITTTSAKKINEPVSKTEQINNALDRSKRIRESLNYGFNNN